MSFDPVDYAKTDLVPLLSALCRLTEDDPQADQHRYFGALLHSIERCSNAVDLAEPMMELSMSAFLGFQYTPAVAMILDQLLAHAQELTEVLSLEDEALH